MKRSRLGRMMILVLAVVMVFAFATTAFAAQSSVKTFDAGRCKRHFTTTQSLTKPAGSWYTFFCRATMSWEGGQASWDTLNATPKTGSGYAAGNPIIVQYSTTTGYGVYAHSYKTTYRIYYLIDNPHDGYNMPCEGSFWGNTN